MSESAPSVPAYTSPESRADLVRLKFPPAFGIIRVAYYASFGKRTNPLGTVDMLILSRWVESGGSTRVAVYHPTAGQIELVLQNDGVSCDEKTFNILRDAVVDAIPTETSIRDIVVRVVNDQWGGAIDGVSEATLAAGEVKLGLAALKLDVKGVSTGLDALKSVGAALPKMQAEVGAVLTRAEAIAAEVDRRVAAHLKRADARIEDLSTANRTLNDRVATMDALLRQLVETESGPPAPSVEAPAGTPGGQVPEAIPGKPDPLPTPNTAELNSKGLALWVRIDNGNYMQVRGLAGENALLMPAKGLPLPQVKLNLLAQMKQMVVFTTPATE